MHPRRIAIIALLSVLAPLPRRGLTVSTHIPKVESWTGVEATEDVGSIAYHEFSFRSIYVIFMIWIDVNCMTYMSMHVLIPILTCAGTCKEA